MEPGEADVILEGNVMVRLLIGLCLLVCATGQVGASHPTLIQTRIEMCATCHEDLLENNISSHAPVEEDCTSCHEVAKGEGGTEITLTAPEPELCLMCHDGMTDAAAGELASPHAAVMDSCLSCHQVHGSEHPALLAADPRQVCLTCHDFGDIAPSHSDRLPENADCMSCHLPHGGPNDHMFRGSKMHAPFIDGSCDGCHRKPFGERVRMRNRGEKLCTACHGSFDIPEGGFSHAALTGKKGRAGCLNCHDPHMSNSTDVLKADGPELCSPCHQEIVAAARGENGHFPAAEDCLGCHTPHVSSGPRLLSSAPKELCLTCHDPDDGELSGKHLGAGMAGLDCTSCHDPHGSAHGKLLARNLHPPLQDGCDTCHEGGADKLMEDGESSLCLMCHDTVGEMAESAQFPHAAMEMIRCADCHNAHASPNERLVSGDGGQVCSVCHDSKTAGEGETGHGAVDRFGCQACHLPHGGDQVSMLRIPGDDLCLGCHGIGTVRIPDDGSSVVLLDRYEVTVDEARALTTLDLFDKNTRGHPIEGHLVRGTPKNKRVNRVQSTYQGELGCLTCHDPHKGTGGYLFRWNAGNRMEACTHCHPGK